ncbi:MAG: alkaline phosphatase family protein [Deltaproteobacteria bacterium]|nr:alkaline phosphatase family protein [Deltaproteobacteria bacterium]
MPVTRRQVIAGAGAIASAQACKPEAGDTSAEEGASVEHIVFVMMENRSYDHFLGAMTLLEGRDDLDGLAAEMSNPDASGTAVTVYRNDTDCQDPDPHHGWNSSHEQFNDGANDGFVIDYGGPGVMQYMRRDDLPITWALADEYAVCDRYFCSVMGPTWPNRFYGHCGTSDGMTGNDFPEGGSYDLPHVWGKLAEAGVSAQYYFSDLPFTILMTGANDPDNLRYFEDFVRDAELGRLPAVSWVDPGFAFNDDHPPHHVAMGQEFLAAVYKALANSPQWTKILLVITYDEHGGFFDHVPPPTTDDDHAADGFDQLGFRVPTLCIGPWVKQGAVSAVFNHASWLRYVCDTHGIEPWTKRIAASTSIAECLDLDRMSRNEPLEPIELPSFDYDDDSVPEACYGQGVFGPPPPAEEAPAGPPSPHARSPVGVTEPWHGVFAAVHREENRLAEWRALRRWIHDYVRGKPQVPFKRG